MYTFFCNVRRGVRVGSGRVGNVETTQFSFLLQIKIIGRLYSFAIEQNQTDKKYMYFVSLLQTILMQWWDNIIKLTRTNIQIYSDTALYTERISEYIHMRHIYRTNIRIYLYSRNSTNTNKNNIRGSFYSNIWKFVLITDWRIFQKGSLMLSENKISHWIFLNA